MMCRCQAINDCMRQPSSLKCRADIITLLESAHKRRIVIFDYLDKSLVFTIERLDIMPRFVLRWAFALYTIRTIVTFEMKNGFFTRKAASRRQPLQMVACDTVDFLVCAHDEP